MFRDILTNKWVLGGVGFLILLSVACVVWYQHDIAPERKAAAEAEELLRQSQIAKKVADTDSEAVKASAVLVESNTLTAEKPIHNVTPKSEEQQQSDVTSETIVTADVRVSPYGFGPYPEIPEDFEEQVGMTIWTDIELYGPADPDIINVRHQELMDRVLIKVWNDDPESRKYMEGAFYRNGKVYVNYSNRAYVRYKTIELPDRTERVITSWTAGSLKAPVPDPVNPFQSNDDQIPNGIELIDLDKEDPGIDPYTFLGL
ncbi:MAG: hypothetical protein OXI67_09635 [Candidatus Poribacteria bacterium]|nr:hypothetical protein [Candidatus Poribacteria bacterium]